jgi:glucan phosphoethanolaminetransferase (alkaline phosphatase superfamily)
MAQALGYNRSNSPNEDSQRRTFWVLYFMEKVSCFTTGKVSVFHLFTQFFRCLVDKGFRFYKTPTLAVPFRT